MKNENKIDPTRAAAILGVGRPRLRQFVASRVLKTAGKFGNTTMFLESTVRKFKKARDAARKNGKGKR